MLDRLSNVVDEYETLERQLSDPEVLADPDQLRRLSKRYTELGPVVEAHRRLSARRADADAAREMLVGASGDERDMLVAEIDAATADVAAIEIELRDLMLPTDPHDGKNVIMEIRGAEGGEEANLFARDLYEMYLAYAQQQGWKLTTLSSSPRSRATEPSRDPTSTGSHGCSTRLRSTSSRRVASAPSTTCDRW